MKVCYYPNGLAGGQRTLRYVQELGIEWTKDPKEPGITHYHHYNYANKINHLPKPLEGKNCININLRNIKKDYLDDLHEEVFGYRLRIDPTSHRGVCIKRSTQNAIHHGKFIECPMPPHMIDNQIRVSGKGEPHQRIYVKMIDTRINDTTIRDWRFVYMGGLVMCFEKHIASNAFFHVKKEDYFKVFPHYDPPPQFSAEEINKIGLFARSMHLDYGEIDVLRDNSTGLIYICDVNPVPAGPIWNATDHPEKVINYLSQQYKNLLDASTSSASQDS